MVNITLAAQKIWTEGLPITRLVRANFTRKYRPVELVYYEKFERIDEAFSREKQVQGWSRKKKRALINGEYGKLPELSRNYTEYGPSAGSEAGR